MREAADLSGLAGELAAQGKTEAAKLVLSELPRRESKDGPTRFMPLPEVVEPRNKTQAPTQPAGVEEIRARTAAALFELAGEAARSESGQYALASVCLRAVLERDPDHKEARRLLGYVPHGGGWATPFAVGRAQGKERQPSRRSAGCRSLGAASRPVVSCRLPRAGVRRRLAGFRSPRPTACARTGGPPGSSTQSTSRSRHECAPGRSDHLRAPPRGLSRPLHDAVRRHSGRKHAHRSPFQEPEAPARRPSQPPRLHQVWYFASKAEFVEHLSPRLGAEVALNLGFYDPPKSGRGRVPAYFYRDPDGQIPETATLYHEVSHQLLFETAGPNSYTKNFGNFWVFEGLGTYFETVSRRSRTARSKSAGWSGPRIAEAYQTLVVRHGMIPLAKFVAFDESTFRDKIQIYQNYQQAMALTVFLMQWDQGAYRDGFLDYVRDAYHGRIKRGVSRGIQDRLHQPYAILEKQFLTFLKECQEPERTRARRPKPAGDAIRTVPSQ